MLGAIGLLSLSVFVLTATALSGAPNAYVESRAGHFQFAITERYVHAAKHSLPEAAGAAEAFVFGTTAGHPTIGRG